MILFFLYHIHAFACKLERRRTEPCPCQKQVVIGPFENEFGEMVDFRVLQQPHGADAGEGVLTDNRFDIVIEIYNVGFPEA